MQINSLTAMPIQQLKRAVIIREQIEALTQELNDLTGSPAFRLTNGNGNGHHAVSARNGGVKTHGLTPTGRARIAAAQRLRWSKYNTARGTNRVSVKAANSQRLSAAGRAKVSAAVKARWERYRAAKAKNR